VKPLIIGVGNRWRGDDGIGPRTVDAIAHLGRADLDAIALDGEPARLVSAWTGRRRVIVIDAIRSGATPGTIHHLVGLDQIPATGVGASTHGGGVAAAVALGRALGALPDRLVVLGIEPATTGHGDQLSPAVAGALDEVIDRVLEEASAARV
jgi:hydrogenase maturation protease